MGTSGKNISLVNIPDKTAVEIRGIPEERLEKILGGTPGIPEITSRKI